jgi:GntR family transcriptional regulator, rspAB operon transcriptional repressor
MARSRPQIPLLAPSAPADGERGAIGRSAYQTLRGAILDCTFAPGMALSEQSVSEQLEISRAPVREAFRRLVMEGLLESAPQRGTFVARLHRGRIADAVFVREAIECRAAELAARAPAARCSP